MGYYAGGIIPKRTLHQNLCEMGQLEAHSLKLHIDITKLLRWRTRRVSGVLPLLLHKHVQ